MSPRPVVLVHGACHGAWCWAAVQAELDRRGVPSFAVDLPGHGASTAPLEDLHGDAASVSAVLDKLDDDVVLVGHSYGGSVITQAGVHPRAAHLVYLSAILPDAGESTVDALATVPGGAGLADIFVRTPEGAVGVDPGGAVAAFYGTCEPAAAEAAKARLCVQRAATLRQPVSVVAWRERPSTYIRCLQDGALAVRAQDHMAARCSAVLDLDTDHSPFICAPGALADLLEPLAIR